ncbi:hypothetical protein Sru01_25770 [Sphaerisporangium rufum]|uniref:HTH araC/xylS-type domain-containing protein n=1 Tax=Sphaerisporangium rufum TaxID=1381558 RepID=A0A919V4T5_9ACTN|nr:hypothetical protein Sru01_25770 [Sphaerisporangium rufum]
MPGALRPWVADVRVATADAGRRRILAHLPDTATALVFRALDDRQGDLMVVGPRTRAVYHPGKHVPFGLRLRLRPSRAALLLGVPVSELADRVVPLRELWGASGDRLVGELSEQGHDHAPVLRRIGAELLARVSRATSDDRSRSDLVRAAITALSATSGDRPGRVPEVARRLGVSERHLRGLVTGGVGVSPKRLVRIHRLRTVLARAQAGSWARLAVEAGYYDQSHFTGEFRRTMGVSPGSFITGRLPAPAPCRPEAPIMSHP